MPINSGLGTKVGYPFGQCSLALMLGLSKGLHRRAVVAVSGLLAVLDLCSLSLGGQFDVLSGFFKTWAFGKEQAF